MPKHQHLVAIDISPWLYRSGWLVQKRVTGLPDAETFAQLGDAAAQMVVASLLRVIGETRPTHVAMVFDAGDSGRKAIAADYKGTRSATRDPVLHGIVTAAEPRVRALLEALPLPVVAAEGYEADDALATLAQQARAADYFVTIVTPDKDALQLVAPRVRVGAPWLQRPWHTTDADVIKTMGVPAGRVAEYLALVGDKADNIAGVHGIGEVHASRLLLQMSLEEILAAPTPVDRQIKTIQKAHESARLALRLTTMVLTVPVPALTALRTAPESTATPQVNTAHVDAVMPVEPDASSDQLDLLAGDGLVAGPRR